VHADGDPGAFPLLGPDQVAQQVLLLLFGVGQPLHPVLQRGPRPYRLPRVVHREDHPVAKVIFGHADRLRGPHPNVDGHLPAVGQP
jgi:hypothetical protein